MHRMTWGVLFKYVEKKVNFRRKDGDMQNNSLENITWTCNGTLKFVEEFLHKHYDLSIDEILSTLYNCGGHCDCEVIFNCQDRISPDKPLPKNA